MRGMAGVVVFALPLLWAFDDPGQPATATLPEGATPQNRRRTGAEVPAEPQGRTGRRQALKRQDSAIRARMRKRQLCG